MTIINRIEKDIAELVWLTSYFAELSTRYHEHYRHSEKANRYFNKAIRYAQKAVSLAVELGLKPEVVCPDEVSFLKIHSKAA